MSDYWTYEQLQDYLKANAVKVAVGYEALALADHPWVCVLPREKLQEVWAQAPPESRWVDGVNGKPPMYYYILDPKRRQSGVAFPVLVAEEDVGVSRR